MHKYLYPNELGSPRVHKHAGNINVLDKITVKKNKTVQSTKPVLNQKSKAEPSHCQILSPIYHQGFHSLQ